MSFTPLFSEGFQVTNKSLVKQLIGESVDTAVSIRDVSVAPPYTGCDFELKIPTGQGLTINSNKVTVHSWSTGASSNQWYGIECWININSTNATAGGFGEFLNFGEGLLKFANGSGPNVFELQIFHRTGGVTYATSPSDNPLDMDTYYRLRMMWKSHDSTGECKVWIRKFGDSAFTLIAASDTSNDFHGGTARCRLVGYPGSTAEQPIDVANLLFAGVYGGEMTESDGSDFLTNPEWIRFSVHHDSTGAADCTNSGAAPGSTPSAGNWKNIGAETAGDGEKDPSVVVQMSNLGTGGKTTEDAGPDTGGYGDSANESGPLGHPLIGSDWVAKFMTGKARLSIAKSPGAQDGWFIGKATGNRASSPTYTILEFEYGFGGGIRNRRLGTASPPGLTEVGVFGFGASDGKTVACPVGFLEILYDKPDATARILGPPVFKSPKPVKSA